MYPPYSLFTDEDCSGLWKECLSGLIPLKNPLMLWFYPVICVCVVTHCDPMYVPSHHLPVHPNRLVRLVRLGSSVWIFVALPGEARLLEGLARRARVLLDVECVDMHCMMDIGGWKWRYIKFIGSVGRKIKLF